MDNEFNLQDEIQKVTRPEICNRGALNALYCDIWSRSNPRSPNLCMAAALQSMAIMIGQHFNMMTGSHDTRANLQTIAIAPTGSGKDMALKYPQKIARDIYDADFVFGKINTPTTIEYQLNRYGYAFGFHDECGDLLKATRAGAGSSKQLAEIGVMLKSLSTSAHSFYKGADFSPAIDRDKPKLDLSSEQPFFTYMGVGTPRQCFDAFEGADIEGGYLGRLAMFIDNESHDEIAPYEIETPVGDYSPEVVKIVGKFKDLICARRYQWQQRDKSEDAFKKWDRSRGKDKGDPPEVTTYDIEPEPTEIEVERAAMETIFMGKQNLIAEATEAGDEILLDLAQRVGEMANRFALIDAISDWSGGVTSAPKVTDENALRALELAFKVTTSKRESYREHKEKSKVQILLETVANDLIGKKQIGYQRVATIAKGRRIKMGVPEALKAIHECGTFKLSDVDKPKLLKIELAPR